MPSLNAFLFGIYNTASNPLSARKYKGWLEEDPPNPTAKNTSISGAWFELKRILQLISQQMWCMYLHTCIPVGTHPPPPLWQSSESAGLVPERLLSVLGLCLQIPFK